MTWKDKEKRKAYDEEYRKTPQYIAYQKAYRKEYYQKNKEKKLEQARTPHRKEYMKQYAEKNKQQLKEYKKAYYEKHKETKWKDTSGWIRNLEHEKVYYKKPEVIARRTELNKIRYDNRSKEKVEKTKEIRQIRYLERMKDPLERKKFRDYAREYARQDWVRHRNLRYGKAQRDNLTDQYLIKRLQSTDIHSTDKTILEIKRLQLKIDREIRLQKQL